MPGTTGKLDVGLADLMRNPLMVLLFAVATAMGGSGLAQQPVRPLPKLGGCPIGYFSSGAYCVPSTTGQPRGAIEKLGNSCPLGFYSSGNYCVSSAANSREAIHKSGTSCPLGWFSSGPYCLKSR